MLVVLPPSETKAPGGRGRPLDLDALSFPSLNPTRKVLVDEVVALAADLPASRAALDISERQDDEIARNAGCGARPPRRRCAATPGCSTTRWTRRR